MRRFEPTPGMLGYKRPVEKRASSNDVHVLPCERPHAALPSCWCGPTINYVADNGNKVWLHKRMQ